ncbi:bifunctional nuclease family protein [Myxococcaceae bacterium GXIMD 01537]
MKTPLPASLFLAPLTAALLALGGTLLLPTLASTPAFAAVEQAPHPSKPPQKGQPCVPEKGADAKTCTELVELEVHDVVPLEEAQTHAVVLTTKDGDMVLPIFVDEAAAVAIAFRLAHVEPPHPLAQDLLDDVVEQMGGKVVEVRIDDLRDDIYTGRIFVQQGKRKLELGARPADSIAMALHSDARIRVTRKVLTQAGISRAEIDSLREGGPGVGGGGPPGLDEGAPTLPMPFGGDEKEEAPVPPHGDEIDL